MKRDGFTIVELIIFLAISGLLLTMAMVGSGNLARQARYSDSVNSLHSKIQRTYEDVANGVNTRLETEDDCVAGGGQSRAPGTDVCLLLGKVISFNQDNGTTTTVRYVTDSPIVYSSSGTIQQQINASLPRVNDTAAEIYELSWGASFQVASRETTPSSGHSTIVKPGTNRAIINNIAFLRSPNGSQIIPYYFYSASQDASDVQAGLRIATADFIRSTGTKAYLCVTNIQDWTAASAPVAAIVLGVGQGSVAIDTNFSADGSVAGECNA